MTEIRRRRDLQWPPPFQVRMVLPGEDVFALAVTGAKAGQLGAADVLWSVDARILKAAIVLEPDMPLSEARKAQEALQQACAMALAALLPAQVAIRIGDEGAILVNAGTLGMVKLAIPDAASCDAVPAWIVLHLVLHIARAEGDEGGCEPEWAVLVEEGGEALATAPEMLLAEILRHLRAILDDWTRTGNLPSLPGWLRDVPGMD